MGRRTYARAGIVYAMRDLDATSTLLREARGPGYDVAAAVPLATELGALLPTSDNAVALGLHKP